MLINFVDTMAKGSSSSDQPTAARVDAEDAASDDNNSTTVPPAAAAAAASSAASSSSDEEKVDDHDDRAKTHLPYKKELGPLKTPEDDIAIAGDEGQKMKSTVLPEPTKPNNKIMSEKNGHKYDQDVDKSISDNSDAVPPTVDTGRSSTNTPIHATVMFIPGPDYTGDGIRTGYDSDPEQFINNDSNAEMSAATPEVVPEISAYLVEEDAIEVAQVEEVKPYFRRREGQMTIIIVGVLVASVAILLGVFLSREGNNGAGGVASIPEEVSEVPSMAPTFDPRPTLAIVQDRGVVNCGIEDLREGDINLNEFNIDQCRAVAATIFGDPTKINLVIVDAKDKYEKLFGREVDVLYAGDTFTLEKLIREPTTGEPLRLGYPYYGAQVVYLGLEEYVKCINEQKRYDECDDLSICAVDTPEIRTLITSFFPPSFIRFGPFPEMEGSLNNGTCNVIVTDTYRIFGTSLQDDYKIENQNGTYVMSDNYISRNLLSSVVRNDDGEWFNVVEGSRQAAVRASQIGISKSESQSCPMNSTDNEISFFNAPRCVGNSLEVFSERLSYVVVSFGQDVKLPTIDAPNFGLLECDDCEDVLQYGRLKQIRDRGVLNCAVYMDPQYNLTMTSLPTLMSVKFCEMMSVAIFQGDPNAVNITYIDNMDKSVFPREFDIVAGDNTGEAWDLSLDSNFSPSIPYYYHDKYRYNGTSYDGTGRGLQFYVDKADMTLNHIANAIITAVVYAQRQGITRFTHFEMPLIHLFGDSLTFMLRDVVRNSGNYDDIINEAIALSDGTTDRGWNLVISNSAVSNKVPVFYCDYSNSCPPCVWVEEGYCICYTFDYVP